MHTKGRYQATGSPSPKRSCNQVITWVSALQWGRSGQPKLTGNKSPASWSP